MNFFSKIAVIVFLLNINYLKAQMLTETNPPDFIKSIIFKTSEDDKNAFPIVRVNQAFTLQFDNLNATEETYYYKITHCNADWSVSSLMKSEYLKGMDDQPFSPENNSYATLQAYSHYRLTFPNALTKITLTGNYLLSILDASGNEVFSRKFLIYNPLVSISAEVKRSRDLQFFDSKQVVQFSVKERDVKLQNPTENVKVSILQNYRWHNAITHLKPQYTIGSELIYKYDVETSFNAGNEFLYFDSKDLQNARSGGYLYDYQLITDKSRANNVYTYFPDINGDFLINTLNGQNSANEADYLWVHFSLDAQPSFWDKEVFVYGNFSNYELSDTYKLYYDEKNKVFAGKILLKQGFYNYKFATKDKNQPNFEEIDGNFYQTENNYIILVYYRAVGSLYDEIIGVGSTNGATISM